MNDGKISLLIIEDDEDDYVLTRDMLVEIYGDKLVLDHAANPSRAVEAINARKYDACLLDYRLGVETGLELMPRLMDQARPTPIILLTGQTDLQVDVEAMRAGAADYLEKAKIDARSLERSIRFAMERSRHRDELMRLSADLEREVQQRTEQLRRANEDLVAEIFERRRAQERLQEESERLRTMLESIDDGVIVADSDGRVTLINPVAGALTGWREEGLDRHIAEVFVVADEASGARLGDPVARAVAENRGIRLARQTILIARDGSTRPIEESAAAIHDASGRTRGVIFVFRDIGERRRDEANVRESRERLRFVLEAARIGYWDWNLKTNAIDLDRRCREIFEVDANSAVSSERFLSLLHPLDRERTAADVEAALAKRGDFQTEYRLLRASGEVRWITVEGKAFFEPDGSPVRFSGVVIDVTEQKRMMEELQRQADKLAESDRRKDEFLAMLAHELRNPLAPVRSALEVLRLSEGDLISMQGAREVIERQVRHMVRLIDDLMDVSRITRDKIKLQKQRVTFEELVGAAVETSRPLILASNHNLRVTLPPEPIFLDADPTRLSQVISNILNNSAKYMDPGGSIELWVERRGEEAALHVRDAGIGISAEMLSRIFEPFSQSNRALDRAGGGLGIGLRLVQTLVQMHGGSVEAKSEGVNKGSEFIVRLPIAPEPPAVLKPLEPEQVEEKPHQLSRKRIVLADDNRDSANSLAMLLKLMGHQVQVAFDGRAAIDAVEKYQPDVALLDIGMPGLCGFDVAIKLRQDPSLSGLRLIAITGWGSAEDRRRSRESGFDHHLVKPVDIDVLEKLLA